MTATAATAYSRLQPSAVGGGGGMARSLERILEEANLSGELKISNRKLKDFPKTGTKYNLEDTVIADLSRNRFCELPEEITTFSFLETLLLYHNTIRSVPESVKHLTSLTYLDLRSNQLSTLPREICFLPLQVLLVSNNRLTSLPDELGRMDRLTDLDVSYNQLSSLPARIGELRSLRSFSLRSNQLMYLPRELTCLTLVSLDVSNNRIASLPLEIRQMGTLVEFNIENNPLTSPPASLCVRGLVHVFKFLETQATKDEKGSRAGGNYDGYTTLRRAPRHNGNVSFLETNRSQRHNVDSGYSTCDGFDKRWSHDMPVKSKESPLRKIPTTPPSLSNESMDASLASSTSTIVDESISITAAIVKPLSADSSPIKRNIVEQTSGTLHQHLSYTYSSSSNGSSPDQEDGMIDHLQQQQQLLQQNGKVDEKLNKNLGNIQTYREYKEALKQQRSQEILNVYKSKGQQKTLYDMTEATNALNSNNGVQEDIDVRYNENVQNLTLPKSIMKNGGSNTTNITNGLMNGGTTSDGDSAVISKKPIQKVIPSRNTELMAAKSQTNDGEKSMSNGDCLGYIKPNSPMKIANSNGVTGSGILTNANKYPSNVGGNSKSVVNGLNKLSTPKVNRSVTWNHDIPPEKLSFTMRREFDRQREETELMTQLRSIIETRLKMTLPEDIASALTDGVILCHLANYVRPRSVASIHVPSPGVSKLTMARCRRNVDNFLDACRKIGVDEELICFCTDILPEVENDANTSNIGNNNDDDNNEEYKIQNQGKESNKLPNPSAVLRTVAALISMDSNPHHQNIKNLQQQQEFQLTLQKHQQQLQQRQQYNSQHQHHHHRYQCNETSNHQRQQEHLYQIEYKKEPATSTNQQMHDDQQEYENEIVENVNRNLNCNDDMTQFGEVVLNCAKSEIIFNFNCDDVDDNKVTVTDINKLMDETEQTESSTSKIGNFLRHAKLKTLQKIKSNLLNSHGNNNNNNNNTFTKLSNEIDANQSTAGVLQTIVETENDMIMGDNVETNDDNALSEVYKLVSEKCYNKNDELSLQVDMMSLHIDSSDKYDKQRKLLTLKPDLNDTPCSTVSKRIEFFEHNTVQPINMNNTTITNCSGLNLKPKGKNNILSVYSIANDLEEKLSKECAKHKKEAGSSTASLLLKHDSNVLTIILSCIFIMTFLILVFFPLPG